jgi:itaconate CoA-transferase
MPFVNGEHLIHLSDVLAVVESDEPLMVHPSRNIAQKDRLIGNFIAEQIHDGDTIQLGVGGVPLSVAEALREKNDLGLHSELFSPAIKMLIQNGNINGKRKSLLPNKHVFTLALGDQETYSYMGSNPNIVGYPASFVNDPAVIAQNKCMKSINAAIEVDLTGQVNSESMQGVHWSGPGGQLDFVRGAYASEGGQSFIALYSTARADSISRIVPMLNGPVTDSRMDVHYVVTEFGMVNLKGKSISERANALISIAHPNFRDQLREQAIEIGLIYN